jgi:hypothetical protein
MSSRGALRLALGVTIAGVGLYTLRRAARSRLPWRAANGVFHASSPVSSQAKPPSSSSGGVSCGAAGGPLTVVPTAYPSARRDETVVDVYPGGHSVKDPYRWLVRRGCGSLAV